MNIEQAARKLLDQINAPNLVSVLVWYGDTGNVIKVWHDQKYVAEVQSVPTTFEGFKVMVEPRKQFTAMAG